MEPEIKAGENIIIKKCKDYNIGDVITYISEEGVIITHRIISKDKNTYYTKGDFNNIQDTNPVLIEQIYGKVIFHFNSFFPVSFFSLARYINSSKTSVTTKIANPIFIVDGDNEINIKNSDSLNSYNFTIRNYNATNISDVSFNYNIEIIADDTLKYQLFLDNKLVDINNTFNLPYINPKEDKYVLKIEAPDNYEGNVKINVYAYQMEVGNS